MIEGSKHLKNKKNIPNSQLVKTCCGDFEIFDLQAKRCISVSKKDLLKGTKTEALYPYLGNWKHKKEPALIHIMETTWGFDNRHVVYAGKKVSLIGATIELS